jgi:FKBP-type peptidyl-prolyl cis-trans isomerase FklB
MQKYFVIGINLVFVAFLLCGRAHAQQNPASGSPSTPASKTPAAKPAQAPAAKSTAGTAAKSAAAAPELNTDKEKGSYAVGLNIGASLKQQPVDFDLPSLFRGIKDAHDGNKPALTDDEIEAQLKILQAQANQKRDAEMQKAGEANMKEGEAFLAANKAQDGVVTLPSGLQYKILTPGTGDKPSASDTVVCNYRGTFINGTEFDSSYKRGKPAEFQVGGVIKGWTEALQLMPVGSKWQLVVPSDLAYGSRGMGGAIGPDETLIFEVELISIKGK